MSELPLGLGRDKAGQAGAIRVGVVEAAIGVDSALASLRTLFPQVEFISLQSDPAAASRCDIVIVPATPADGVQVLRRLKTPPASTRVVIVLEHADLAGIRTLASAGADDVLAAPVTETNLALCLERLLRDHSPARAPERPEGEVVAFLKAGGGVGATWLAAQTAALLAGRDAGSVCLADLDMQFGAAATYLDLPDAMTTADVLALGSSMVDADLVATLAAHRSGARVLAAPRDITPLDAVKPVQAANLIELLRRDFALTLVDLPSNWTAWSHRVLSSADRIVLVTRLTVPHVQMTLRQLRFLTSQKLDEKPVTLVCNALAADQQASLPVKVAEKTIGRSFDVIVPDDARNVLAAINEGVVLAQVRRGTKIEKAVEQLADKAAALEAAPAARRWF